MRRLPRHRAVSAESNPARLHLATLPFMFHELVFPKGKDEIGDYGVTNPAEAVNSSPGGATRQFPASGPDGSKQPAQTIRSQSRSAAAATLTVYASYDSIS